MAEDGRCPENQTQVVVTQVEDPRQAGGQGPLEEVNQEDQGAGLGAQDPEGVGGPDIVGPVIPDILVVEELAD